MHKFWNPDPLSPGSCFDFPLYFLVMTLADMLIDLAIICLPIKIILGLHLSLRQRLGLLGIFLLGIL